MGKLSFKSGGYLDAGLLFLRIGIGLMFVFAHGLPKLMGGPERWDKVGSSLANFGIDSGHMYWGLAAGIAETLGGLLLIFGLMMVPACLMLLAVLFVAAIQGFAKGMGLGGASHAIEDGILIVSLLLIGPGRYSLDHKLF